MMLILELSKILASKQVHCVTSLSMELGVSKEEIKIALDLLKQYGFLNNLEIINVNGKLMSACKTSSLEAMCSSCKMGFCLLKTMNK